MNTIVELEQQDIELQIKEVQLKRKLNELKRQQLTGGIITIPPSGTKITYEPRPPLLLTYAQGTIKNLMRIADVCPDGSIKIYIKGGSVTYAKKYSMKSLLWIKKQLPKWSLKQKQETGFFKKVSETYSRRFLKGENPISRTTMEKLCYMVDSGKADEWFEKYDYLKHKGKQSTLDEGLL